MFAYKPSCYQKLEKPKQDRKCKQNSYDEIRKLVDEGRGIQLKEAINTKKGNTIMETLSPEDMHVENLSFE